MSHQPDDGNTRIYDAWHTDVYQTDIVAYHARALPLIRRIIQRLSLTPFSTGRLLDIACGKGIFLMDVATTSPRVKLYGADISRVAIREAKKLVPGADVVVSDAASLPYTSGRFDYVTCVGGLEYVPDPVKGIAEMARVLKKGGLCVLYVPNLMFIGYLYLALRYGTMPSHGGSSGDKTYYDFMNERFYTLEGWNDIITKGGMNVVSVDRYDNLGSSKYASPFLIYMYDKVISRFVPKTLAYCYLFTCSI